MRRTKQTHSFKKDLKREAKGRYRHALQKEFTEIVRQLALDRELPARYRDHALTGDWVNHRECHIESDLLLIYLKTGGDTLHLVRLGTHSELF